MKKICFVCVLTCLIAFTPSFVIGNAWDEKPTGPVREIAAQIYLDGEPVALDSPVLKCDDRILIPARAFGEAVGAEVLWTDGDISKLKLQEQQEEMLPHMWDTLPDQMCLLRKNDLYILNGSGKRSMFSFKHKYTCAPVPAILYQDRFYVPLRIAAENFGYRSDWEEETQSVHLTKSIEALLSGTSFASWYYKILQFTDGEEPDEIYLLDYSGCFEQGIDSDAVFVKNGEAYYLRSDLSRIYQARRLTNEEMDSFARRMRENKTDTLPDSDYLGSTVYGYLHYASGGVYQVIFYGPVGLEYEAICDIFASLNNGAMEPIP